MISEKTRGVLSWDAATRMSSPNPLPPPRNSPTTAPTTTSTAAFFKPAKKWGMPMGSFSLTSVCQRVAPMVRKSMRSFSSAACSPAAVPTMTGKIAMKEDSATFEAMPKPSQDTNRGAKATLGMALIATK